MKYRKLLAMCLLPLAFVACSDDDASYNTGEATVEFSQATLEIKESIASINLPIVVTGTHDGLIKVSATMTGSNGSNLEIDKNVIITTETLNMPAGTESVNLEVRLEGVTNDEIENGRNIVFEITNVEGATLGANTTCTINILENNPLEGAYRLTGFDPFNGAVGYLECNVTMDENDESKLYMDFGFGGMLQVNLEEVEPLTLYNVTIPAGQVVGQASGYGDVYFTLGTVDWNTGSIAADLTTEFTGTWDNGIITLDVPAESGAGIYTTAQGGGWFYLYISTVSSDGSILPLTLEKQ